MSNKQQQHSAAKLQGREGGGASVYFSGRNTDVGARDVKPVTIMWLTVQSTIQKFKLHTQQQCLINHGLHSLLGPRQHARRSPGCAAVVCTRPVGLLLLHIDRLGLAATAIHWGRRTWVPCVHTHDSDHGKLT